MVLFSPPTINPPLPPYVRKRTDGVHGRRYSRHNPPVRGISALPHESRLTAKYWNRVYVSAHGRDRNAILIALNSKDGRTIWSTRVNFPSAIVATDQTVFTQISPLSVSALDAHTRRVKWTSRLIKKADDNFGNEIESITLEGNTLALNAATVTFGIDAQSGKMLWSRDKSYLIDQPLVHDAGILWVPHDEGSEARDFLTGKTLWNADVHYGDFGGVLTHRFVCLARGKAEAIDEYTGNLLWAKTISNDESSGGRMYGAVLGNIFFAQGMRRLAVFDPAGHELASLPEGRTIARPIWSDGTYLVCYDGSNLYQYVHGARPSLPTDTLARRALANDLVAHFAELDEEDRSRLADLKSDAFAPLLTALLKTTKKFDLVKEKVSMHAEQLDRQFRIMGQLLPKVTTAANTPQLLDALSAQSEESSAKPILLTLLQQFADPAVITPYFLKQIAGERSPGYELYESTSYIAREYIINSQDPRAIAFMTDQLKNPNADRVLRQEAYWHLAGTGGDKGAELVLSMRKKRAFLPPLEERVTKGFLGAGEFSRKTNEVAQRTDATGKTYGLLTSGVLGNGNDLWFAEKVNGEWVHPLFTGVSTGKVSGFVKHPPPPPTIAGKTAEQLVHGDWLEALLNNEEIHRDTDHDGLTDLEEKRLGTSLDNRDTDGDGGPDSIDPWPNAAPRELNDDEQILAAVFEARFHFDKSAGTAIFYAPWNMKPFEMPGREGPTMWVPANHGDELTSPLEQCYQFGVAFVGFANPDVERKSGSKEVIEWNRDRTEATTLISVYYGGLNGTGYTASVRKFHGQWVVTSLKMTFIS